MSATWTSSSSPNRPAPPTTTRMRTATKLASSLIRICGQVAWPVDAALRPEGKNGRWYARSRAMRATAAAGPGPGNTRRWSRRGRSPVTSISAGSTSTCWPPWYGTPPPTNSSSRTSRRCGAASRTRCRAGSPTGSSNSAAAGCATWSSPSSCCSWSTAGRTRPCATAAPCSPSRHSPPADTSDGRTPRRWPRRTDSCASPSTGCSLPAAPYPSAAGRAGRNPPPGPVDGPRPGRPGGRRRGVRGRAHPARGEVRRLHEKLFYRPLLTTVARMPTDQLRLTPAAARERLTALGFADPDGALNHIAALTAGVSRRAASPAPLNAWCCFFFFFMKGNGGFCTVLHCSS